MTQPLQGQAAVDQLLEILDLKQVDAATFTGDSPQTGAQRVFGGQVAGQALVAAGRTVDPARTVHSLHGYFVRPGDPTEPITFHVETIRDGRSFSVRRSTAKQHGKTIFFMSASFQVLEEGLDHHEPAPEGVPAPEDVPTMRDWVAKYPSRRSVFNASPQAVDVRYLGQPGWVPPGDRDAEPQQRVWMRIDGKLPDDPLIHACALTYASDLSLLDAVLSYHGEVWGPGGVVGRAWTTRSGSTARSGPTSGSSTTAPARRRAAPVAWRTGGCSPGTAGTSPVPSRRVCCAASAPDPSRARTADGGGQPRAGTGESSAGDGSRPGDRPCSDPPPAKPGTNFLSSDRRPVVPAWRRFRPGCPRYPRGCPAPAAGRRCAAREPRPAVAR